MRMDGEGRMGALMSKGEDRFTVERWCANLIDATNRVADLEYQRKAWFEHSIRGVYDDPVECKVHMFDDCSIERFLTKYDRHLRPEVQAALAAFCSTYDSYPYDAFEDDFRLDDPKWLRVVNEAQAFLRAVRKHGWFKPGPVPDP
jgi:hypothetical protein